MHFVLLSSQTRSELLRWGVSATTRSVKACMTRIDRAKAFGNHLRHPPDPTIGPHCGYGYAKRHGTYRVSVRDLEGVRVQARQRYFCHRCRKTYTPEDPQRAREWRYSRRFQRKALDMLLHLAIITRNASTVTLSSTTRCAKSAAIRGCWL